MEGEGTSSRQDRRSPTRSQWTPPNPHPSSQAVVIRGDLHLTPIPRLEDVSTGCGWGRGSVAAGGWHGHEAPPLEQWGKVAEIFRQRRV